MLNNAYSYVQWLTHNLENVATPGIEIPTEKKDNSIFLRGTKNTTPAKHVSWKKQKTDKSSIELKNDTDVVFNENGYYHVSVQLTIVNNMPQRTKPSDVICEIIFDNTYTLQPYAYFICMNNKAITGTYCCANTKINTVSTSGTFYLSKNDILTITMGDGIINEEDSLANFLTIIKVN
jgi:hypothetical protein